MKTLIVTYQCVPVGGWQGPCKPIIGKYPLMVDDHFSDKKIARLVREYETPHRIVLEHEIVDDGLSYEQWRRQQRADEMAERRRCTPFEYPESQS